MFARLVRQSGVYTLAGIAGKVSGLVLTAFYVNTAYLSVEDYGLFGILRAAMMTALLVAGAGLPLGILRFSTSGELSDDARARVASTALLLATITGALSALALWLAAPLLAGVFRGGPALPGDAEPVRLLALYVFFKTVADVSYTELRHREKAGWYVALSAAESLLLLGFVLLFLVGWREGIAGVMKGYVASSAAVAVGASILLVRSVAWRPSWALVRPMLVFGLPLIVSGLAGRFLYFGDRFVIVQIAGLEANATYELAAQFGTLVFTFLVQGVQMSFTVVGMKVVGDAAAAALYRRSFRHFAAVAGFGALGIGLFASAAARLVATDAAYLTIDAPAFLVAAGFGFNGLYGIAVSALYAASKTRAVALGVGAAAVLNLVLNLALVPLIGITGSALATLVAYAALAVWAGQAAAPLVGTRLPWGGVAGVALATGALWALGQLADASQVGGFALRAGVLTLYPAALVGLGVYGRADAQAALALVRRRLGGARRGA